MIDVVIDNRVRLAPGAALEALLTDDAFAALIAEHEHKNPDYAKAKRFGAFTKRIPKQIVTWRREDDGAISFPRGSLGNVRAALALSRFGNATTFTDHRSIGDQSLGRIPPHEPPSPLWEHQRMLVDAAAFGQTVLVRSAAGSGKTTAALALIAQLQLPAIVVVHNQNLLRQWIDRCVAELGVPRSWVGVIASGKRRVGPITIGMQQTLTGCIHELAPVFGVVVVDEVHRSAARTFLEVVDATAAKYRVGISDDERRADRKEFLIYDMFGPVAYEASHDELVDAGVIMDVAVRVVPTEFRADWYVSLNHKERLLAYDQLMRRMLEDRPRNFLAMRDVPSHVAHGRQVIVFTHRIEHALELDRVMSARAVASGFIVGEHPVESAETLKRFVDGRTRVVFGTYQSLGTGIDIPKVTRGVFATPIANGQEGRSQFKQYRGRFARSAVDKELPEIIYLWDRHVFGTRALRHLCRWTKDVKVEWRGALVPGRQVLKEIETDET